MTPEVSRAEWIEAQRVLRADIKGVNDRLDILNGRTRKIEIASAVHWVLWLCVGAGALALLPILASHLR